MILANFAISLFLYKKREKGKKRKKSCIGLVQPTTKPAARIQPRSEKKAHQERPTRIWTFCIRNPDVFHKLLRPSQLFFLSTIFTSGTPYYFLFSFLLLISVGNETKTEPVIGGERGRKKYGGNFAFFIRYRCMHVYLVYLMAHSICLLLI
jgi:hypothetical protein